MTPDLSAADVEYLREAIAWAQRGVDAGGSAFGAVVVRTHGPDGQPLDAPETVAAVHNVVLQTTDITAHAEVHALREACRALGTIDLAGCTLYSSCEPCPMCFSAIHWANIDRIVYGATIADAERCGFRELPISNATMKRLGNAPVRVDGPHLRDEAVAVFDAFVARGGTTY